jgi:hypothetical protein
MVRGRWWTFPISLALNIAISGVLGYFAFRTIRAAPANLREGAVGFVFLILYLYRIVIPLIGYQVHEFYDFSKLYQYPVSPLTIFTGALLGSFLGLPALQYLGAFLGMALALGGGLWLWLWRAVLFLLFALHVIALSHLLQLILLNLLSKRILREIAVLGATLFSVGLYLFFRFGIRGMGGFQLETLVESPVYNVLRHLPPLWLSGVFSRMSGIALFRLLAFLSVTVLLVWVGSRLQLKAFFSEVVFSKGGKKHKPDEARAGAISLLAKFGTARRYIPEPILAVCSKELVTLRREPGIKNYVIRQFGFLIIPFLAPLFTEPELGNWIYRHLLAYANYLLLFCESFLVTNIFGTEGVGIVDLFSFPTGRRRVILGKNLCHFAVLSLVNIVILSGMNLFVGDAFRYFLQIALNEILLVVLIAYGNPISIWMPRQLIPPTKRSLEGTGGEKEGCAMALIRFAALGAVAASLAPVLLAVYLGLYFAGPLSLLISLPLSAIFAGGLYYASLVISAQMLPGKEEKLAEYLLKSWR